MNESEIDDQKDRSPKCQMLIEFYDQVEKTNRNYWVMTEIFCFMHDGDVCNYKKNRNRN
jgi:hypothetical protein